MWLFWCHNLWMWTQIQLNICEWILYSRQVHTDIKDGCSHYDITHWLVTSHYEASSCAFSDRDDGRHGSHTAWSLANNLCLTSRNAASTQGAIHLSWWLKAIAGTCNSPVIHLLPCHTSVTTILHPHRYLPQLIEVSKPYLGPHPLCVTSISLDAKCHWLFNALVNKFSLWLEPG